MNKKKFLTSLISKTYNEMVDSDKWDSQHGGLDLAKVNHYLSTKAQFRVKWAGSKQDPVLHFVDDVNGELLAAEKPNGGLHFYAIESDMSLDEIAKFVESKNQGMV